MSRWLATMFGGAVIVAGNAHAATQFDLQCDGTMKQPGVPDRPWTVRYRLDLAAMTFCAGECEKISNILAETSSTILLSRTKTAKSEGITMIDRLNGTAVTRYKGPMMSWEGKAVCKPLPFSGMPKPKF